MGTLPAPIPMRLIETSHRLTLDDSARPVRALGAAFVASGAFVLSLPLHLGGWVTMLGWEKVGVVAIGLSHLAGGAWAMMHPAASRLELDRDSGEGVLRWLRPWSRERMRLGPDAETRFRLDDVREVDIVRAFDADGDSTYALRLVLRDGRTLPIQANPIGDARVTCGHAEQVRAFLGIGTAQRVAA